MGPTDRGADNAAEPALLCTHPDDLVQRYSRAVDELEERYVQPFYLHMMRLNAVTDGGPHLPVIRDLGSTITAEDVVRLLRREWRPRVMGAWFALFHDPQSVGADLLQSLETSAGSLTSPPLAVVAGHLMGAAAIPSLERYAAQDMALNYGAAGFAAAVVEHLGGTPAAAAATEEARRGVREMLGVVAKLVER